MTTAPIPRPLPKYDWAFDADGEPVHISQAQRGQPYQCPITGQRMIARLGDQKQHHFAYELRPDTTEDAPVCSPEEVARAVASRWLENAFRAAHRAERPVYLAWTCPLCGQPHTTDLLDGITRISRRAITRAAPPDLALSDSEGRTQVVITVQPPSEHQIEALTQQHILLLVIDIAARRHAMITLDRLLAEAQVLGGVCDLQRQADRSGIITDPDDLRRALIASASAPPYAVHGPLTDLGEFTHILTLGSRRLWLPPELWQRVVGGMRHTISSDVHITSQEWAQPDGATIALFYVTAGRLPDCAVAVRRFPPGQAVYARLPDAQFRTIRAAAATIARQLAEG